MGAYLLLGANKCEGCLKSGVYGNYCYCTMGVANCNNEKN